LIKLNDLQIRKTEQNITDIFFKFEDTKITPEQHKFLKNRLENYRHFINEDYSMELSLEHLYHLETLIINLTLAIPDHIMTNDIGEYTEMVMDQINTFRNFYNAQNIFFEKENLLNLR
jgi:hypothetical protein